MGKFDFEVSPEFIKQLGRLEDVDRIAPQMITEAAPIVETSMRKELSFHKVSGDMRDSVKISKAIKVKNGGYFIVVRPMGNDGKGVENMAKLVFLEYGTKKQSAKPVMAKIVKDSEQQVYAKMQEVFEREVKK